MPSDLSPADLAEGRRLLADARRINDDDATTLDECVSSQNAIEQWLYRHADTLLADREAVAREAVREFAAAVLALSEFDYHTSTNVIRRGEVVAEAAARGVPLESERGA